MTDEQASKVIEMLGRLDERTERIDRTLNGNGQPGLVQKVEGLEASKNRVWGVGAAVTFIGGLVEYLFHRK